ncbi:thioredoxin [Folsomia candida]|uniref:thioredoxin n=1 Tax=Folsomia candida TaxID=158441 RepID=UPI000B902606|nr:thioredoxin [Folsomia candida]
MVINVVYNKPHFDKALEEAASNLVVVEFTAHWCNASASSLKKVADLAAANPTVAFIKVDAEKNSEISNLYKVNSLPTFLFLKDGVQVDRMDYSLPSELEQKVKKHKPV